MSRPRIVIVGAGFAGYRTARTLERLTRHRADITLVDPTDYFLYSPLLPQVAAGVLAPRRVTISLTGTLPRTRLVLAAADGADLDARTVRHHPAALPGNRVRVDADWLLDAVLPCQGVQLGIVRSWSMPLDTASPEPARVPGARAQRERPAESEKRKRPADPEDRVPTADAENLHSPAEGES